MVRQHLTGALASSILLAAALGCGQADHGTDLPTKVNEQRSSAATSEQAPANEATDLSSANDSNPEQRVARIKQQGPAAVPELIEIVKQGAVADPLSEESDAGMYAGAALGEMPLEGAAALEQLLEDESTLVRKEAAYNLTLIYADSDAPDRMDRLVPVFIKALSEEDLLVRKQVLIGLDPLITNHRHAPSVKSLIPQLSSALSEPRLRYLAIVYLGTLGPLAQEAVPAIEAAAANDDDEIIDEAAAEAIKKIGEPRP